MKILIDTSVWVAFIRSEDSQHQKALKLFSTINFAEVLIPTIVYYEVLTVLRLKTIDPIHKMQKFLLLLEEFKIMLTQLLPAEDQATVDFMLNTKEKFSFVDAYLCVQASHGDVEVFTFDERLERYINNN